MFTHFRANRALRVRATTPYAARLRGTHHFVLGVTVAGVTVSVAVNALDSATLANGAIAGWPPVALLLALEILTRVPGGRWYAALVRLVGSLAVSAAAGWLSYWHMVSTVAAHGESVISAHIWPASVDGLMAVAATAMVEIGARLRALDYDAQVAAIVAPVEVVPAPLIAQVEQALAPAVPAAYATAAQAVEDMRSSEFWGARLGRPGRRAQQ